MSNFLKYTLFTAGTLIVIGVVGFFNWFYNPYEHTLHLNPESVYAEQKGQRGYLITNGRIIDVELGSVTDSRHLLVRKGTIEKIFAGSVPDSLKETYTVVDAGNKYIMPGLIDMHAHLNSGGLTPPDASTRLSALEQFLRYGVTTIFTLGGHGFNQDVTKDLILKEENNELIAPEIYAAGDILTAPGGYPIPLVPMMTGLPAEEIDLNEQGIITVTSETDLDAILSKKEELGLNGVKIMVESGLAGMETVPRLSDDTVEKIVEAASRYNLPVFAHTSRQDDLKDAVEAGVDAIVHTVGDQKFSDMEPLFEKMKADSIYYIPTLSIAYMPQYIETAEILDDPFYVQYSSERTSRSLENWPVRMMISSSSGRSASEHKNIMLENFALLYEAGVPILMGADAGNPTVIPGYSAHMELEYMGREGMSAAEILRSATIAPARFLGADQTTGSIAEGKAASLIILNENPLEDIRNTRSIDRVMHEGYWIE